MDDTMPIWERRFRAPKLTLPLWSSGRPDRCVYESNVSGVWQVHTFDASTGETRQVSDHPVGVLEGYATIDGDGVLFWQEDTGDETGRWLLQAFEGGGTEPFLDGVPIGWSEGLSQGPGIVAAGFSTDDGAFEIYVSLDGEPAKSIARSTAWTGLSYESADIAGLSADGSLLAVQHAEHGDITHPALRIVDPRTGAVVAERGDGTSAVIASAWSPVAGDQRLAVGHEPEDRERVAIWDLATGQWRDLPVDLAGDLRVLHWFPDASAVLVAHRFEGRDTLHRVDAVTGEASTIETPAGSIVGARVRPDGTIWFSHTDGVHSSRVMSDRGEHPIAVDEPPPAGRPFQDWRYRNGQGQEVHGWIVEPDGDGPHPVMVFVHGGPHWLYVDGYMAEVQAYVDAGFLVAMPNYRGSTGYGRAWRDALTGDAGFTDVDDVTAGLHDLLQRDDVDPERTVIAGWSWGGYVTLMELGRYPDLWRVGMAGVPVGDYVMAFNEEAPSLQAMDRALFRGTPEEKPDLYRRSNPITYVDNVRVPVMFVIGENDSRCPLGQALAYVDRIDAAGVPHEVYRYTTGHGSADIDEEVRQVGAILGFLRREVPGLAQTMP